MSATASNTFNATCTILVPSDFGFSIAAGKFDNNHHRLPPHPSTSLFLYHTIDQPLTLQDLRTHPHEDELHTLFDQHYLFISKNANGDLYLTGSRESIEGTRIRHSNLYVDDNLPIHGLDGVLDPSSASKCYVPNSTVTVKLHIDRNFLELASRALMLQVQEMIKFLMYLLLQVSTAIMMTEFHMRLVSGLKENITLVLCSGSDRARFAAPIYLAAML